MADTRYYPFEPEEDEEVVIRLRKSLVVLSGQLWPLLLGAIALLGFWTIARAMPESFIGLIAQYLAFASVGIGVLLIMWGTKRILDWRFTIYEVTTKRVLAKSGIIAERRRESPLENIQDVTYELRGAIRAQLKIGDLFIETAGFSSDIVFRAVDNVLEVQEIIFKQIALSKWKARRRRVLKSGNEFFKELGIDMEVEIPKSPDREGSVPPILELMEENAIPVVWRKHKFLLIKGIMPPLILALAPILGTAAGGLLFSIPLPFEGIVLIIVRIIRFIFYIWVVGSSVYKLVRGGSPPSRSGDQEQSGAIQSVMAIPERLRYHLRRLVFAPLSFGIIAFLLLTLVTQGIDNLRFHNLVFRATSLQSLSMSFAVLFAVLYYSGIIIWLIYEFVDWSNDQYILRGNHIINVERVPPLLFEQRSQARLTQVQGVTYTFSGIVGRLLGYGNVVIETAGRTPITFINISNPPGIQATIFKRIETVQGREREEIRKGIQEDMAGWFLGMAQLSARRSG
jgi:membrane protein YdbS with pleckstrin-like domain